MNDLISRQAVKDWLEKWRGYLDDDMIARMQIGTKDIEPAQLAEHTHVPERKVGEWIKNEGRYGWHCSACGEDNLYAFAWNCDTGKNELQDHYCPSCGAKMERSEE